MYQYVNKMAKGTVFWRKGKKLIKGDYDRSNHGYLCREVGKDSCGDWIIKGDSYCEIIMNAEE